MTEKSKTARKTVKILGINVTSTDSNRLLAAIKNKVSHNEKFYLTTPNPELVLMAQSNSLLKKALNDSDFAIPDGIGLSQAAKFLSFKAPKSFLLRVIITFFQGVFVGLATLFNKKYLTRSLEIIKGREIFLDLVELASKNNWRVFLLGGESDEAFKTEQILKKRYKDIKILSESGPMIDDNANPISQVDIKLYKDAVDKINKFSPDLLFLAFKNPKTEIFAMEHVKKLNTKGIFALGGTFRYVSGMRKLPPVWMGEYGLEWVWRLINEPVRWRRILNAFPIFPIKVWIWKIKN